MNRGMLYSRLSMHGQHPEDMRSQLRDLRAQLTAARLSHMHVIHRVVLLVPEGDASAKLLPEAGNARSLLTPSNRWIRLFGS